MGTGVQRTCGQLGHLGCLPPALPPLIRLTFRWWATGLAYATPKCLNVKQNKASELVGMWWLPSPSRCSPQGPPLVSFLKLCVPLHDWAPKMLLTAATSGGLQGPASDVSSGSPEWLWSMPYHLLNTIRHLELLSFSGGSQWFIQLFLPQVKPPAHHSTRTNPVEAWFSKYHSRLFFLALRL